MSTTIFDAYEEAFLDKLSSAKSRMAAAQGSTETRLANYKIVGLLSTDCKKNIRDRQK